MAGGISLLCYRGDKFFTGAACAFFASSLQQLRIIFGEPLWILSHRLSVRMTSKDSSSSAVVAGFSVGKCIASRVAGKYSCMAHLTNQLVELSHQEASRICFLRLGKFLHPVRQKLFINLPDVANDVILSNRNESVLQLSRVSLFQQLHVY
eukprot:GHVU01152056.1.p1 GENE.GHVU01152056.1~~GHVU01152056.1.p1  ORF type:complete len:151 (+),score=4.66 GHVU01152056.1:148-600(+)